MRDQLKERIRSHSNFYYSNGQYTMEIFDIKVYQTISIDQDNSFFIEMKDVDSVSTTIKTIIDIDILQDFLVDLLLSDQEKMDKFFRMERRMERRMESLNKLEI